MIELALTALLCALVACSSVWLLLRLAAPGIAKRALLPLGLAVMLVRDLVAPWARGRVGLASVPVRKRLRLAWAYLARATNPLTVACARIGGGNGHVLFLMAVLVVLATLPYAFGSEGSGGMAAAGVVLFNPTARATFALIGWYPVKLYGAVGDGSADDTTPIQTAVTLAQTNGGEIRIAPSAVYYKVTTTIHANRYVNGVSGTEHRTFKLCGIDGGHHFNIQHPTVRWFGSDAADIWDFRSAHGFQFSGVRTTYNSATYAGKMVNLGGTLGSDTSDFWVHDLGFNDDLSSSAGSLSAECNIYLDKTIIGHISDCSFAGSQRAIKTGLSYVVITQIHNNLFVDSALPHHIEIRSADCEKLSILHNTFEAGTSTGALKGADNNNTYGLDFSYNWMGDSSGVDHFWVDGIVAIKDPAVYAFNFFTNPQLVGCIKFGDPDGSNAMGKHFVLGNAGTINAAAFAFDTYTAVGIGAVVDICNGLGVTGGVWKGTPTTNYVVFSPTSSHWGNIFQSSIAFQAGGGHMVEDPDLAGQPSIAGLVVGTTAASTGTFPTLPTVNRSAIYSVGVTGGRRLAIHGYTRASLVAGAAGVVGFEVGESAGASKVGFHGVAPVVRPGAYVQTYAAASRTHAAYTPNVQSSAYTGAADGEAKLVDLNALRVAVENLRTSHESTKQVVNSMIDDFQARGDFQ